jgi:hypothetical protein
MTDPTKKSDGAKRCPKSVDFTPEQTATLKDVSTHLPSAVSTFKRAYGGRSRKESLAAFCLYCMGYDRKAVSACGSSNCPLWKFRPYQKEAG